MFLKQFLTQFSERLCYLEVWNCNCLTNISIPRVNSSSYSANAWYVSLQTSQVRKYYQTVIYSATHFTQTISSSLFSFAHQNKVLAVSCPTIFSRILLYYFFSFKCNFSRLCHEIVRNMILFYTSMLLPSDFFSVHTECSSYNSVLIT